MASRRNSAGNAAGMPSRVVPRNEYMERRGFSRSAGDSGISAADCFQWSDALPMERSNSYSSFVPAGARDMQVQLCNAPMNAVQPAVQPCNSAMNAGGFGISGYGGASSSGHSKAPRQVKDNFVNRVVTKCGPAVVRVETEQKVDMPAVDADVFSFFFGVKPDTKQEQKHRRIHGHGSGYCIDGSTGVILTNAHVVEGADKISVSFPGKVGTFECEVLEVDEVIDLACIRVKDKPKSPLPAMGLGYSESTMTGDWAIVLGNPFGLQNTCTLGIISSLDRSTGETGFDWMRHPLLQTDAAVNQGNSGGPMLNENGDVIGMISMRAMFGEGIGFAIPVDSIKAALPSLMQRQKVPRSYIGIKMTADPDKEGGGSGRSKGCFVDTILPGSPCEAGGFRVGDQIIEAGDSGGAMQKIRHFDEVQAMVRSIPVGSKLRFTVQRGGQTQNLTVEAAHIRKLKELKKPSKSDGGSGGGPRARVFIMK